MPDTRYGVLVFHWSQVLLKAQAQSIGQPQAYRQEVMQVTPERQAQQAHRLGFATAKQRLHR